MAKVPVYLTCGEKRAQYILVNGITGSCALEGISDRDFFEEREKCSFAWLSLEQARHSEFGHVIFEVRVNPEVVYVADLSAACDLFTKGALLTGEARELRRVEYVKIYRRTIQRLSEYLTKGNINPEEVEIIIANPVSPKDITFIERRPLHHL